MILHLPFPSRRMDAATCRKPRGEGVDKLTLTQLSLIVAELKRSRKVTPVTRGDAVYYRCQLAPTKDAKGNPKHPQCTITRFAPLPDNRQHKALVHLIWWRWEHGGAQIPEDLHISHLDADQQVLHLTAERREVNESRKWCHHFGWFRTMPGEDAPRCPHKEQPCTGP